MRNYCISVIPYISEFYRLFYFIKIKFNPSLKCVINFLTSELGIRNAELLYFSYSLHFGILPAFLLY